MKAKDAEVGDHVWAEVVRVGSNIDYYVRFATSSAMPPLVGHELLWLLNEVEVQPVDPPDILGLCQRMRDELEAACTELSAWRRNSRFEVLKEADAVLGPKEVDDEQQ